MKPRVKVKMSSKNTRKMHTKLVNANLIENKREFCQKELQLKLDRWQEKLLAEEEKNIVIRAGRQIGKSTGVALKAFFYALENPQKTVLIVASSQRQSGLLFEKIKSLFVETYPQVIAEEPTLTRLILENGTRIYSLPAGRTGYAIRGFSIDLLIADEAAFIPEAVWVALVPMLAVTQGKVILLSTPFGKGGYFYRCFGDSDFRQFHLSSEDCPRVPKKFLQKEKARLSKMDYAQEYLGEFIEEFTQFFPTALIKERCTFLEWKTKEKYNNKLSYYLGVDVARYGGDENAFVVAEMQPDKKLKIVKVLTTTRISTADTIGRIQQLHLIFDFRRIFVDDMGVGAGVTDVLIDKLGSKVVGINNSTRSIDKEGKRKIKILKEDLYSNLLVMMEQEKIEMIDMPELKRSLQSVQFKYTVERNLKIYGDYSHITEALVRAAWSVKHKGLKLFAA